MTKRDIAYLFIIVTIISIGLFGLFYYKNLLSDAKAMVVHDQFAGVVEPIRSNLKNIAAQNYVIVGKPQDGYRLYEEFIGASADNEPQSELISSLVTFVFCSITLFLLFQQFA